MTDTTTARRRWARRIAGMAGHVLGNGSWSTAMNGEIHAIEDDGEALRWALGCLAAACRERSSEMMRSLGSPLLGLAGITAAVFGCYVVFDGVGKPIVLALPGSLFFILLGGLAIHAVARGGAGPGLLEVWGAALRGPRFGRVDYQDVAARLYRVLHTEPGADTADRWEHPDDPDAGPLLRDALALARQSALPPERLGFLLQTRIDRLAEARRSGARALRTFADGLLAVGAMVAALGFVNLIAVHGMAIPDSDIPLLGATSLVAAILGLFLCKGVFGPAADRLDAAIDDDVRLYGLIKDTLVARQAGLPVRLALRHAIAGLPGHLSLGEPEFDAATG